MIRTRERTARRSATRLGHQPTRVGRALTIVTTLTGELVRSTILSRRHPTRNRLAEGLATGFVRLGSAYLKLGQILASSPGVVGEDVADAFRKCLDAAGPLPHGSLDAALAKAAGRPVAEAYQQVDETAIGSASIAVVHRAVTHDGIEVAVKVRRPDIQVLVAADLALLRGFQRLATLANRSSGGELGELLDDFERTVTAEIDLDAERHAMEKARPKMAAAGLHRVIVPATYASLSDSEVLVMDYVTGRPIDDLQWISDAGLDAGALVDEVIRTWLITSLDTGEFHGDCHAGNLLVLADGRVGLLDWGIVGRLSPRGQQLCTSLLEGSLGVEAAWEDVASLFQLQYGDRLTSGFGITRAELPGALRDLLGPLLTAPFGNRSLADFTDQVKLADTDRSSPTTPAPASAEGDFDRGFFLWLKQLVFFERYARIHHRYRAIANYAAEIVTDRTGTRATGHSGATVSGLHHAGLLCHDLDATKVALEELGFIVTTPMVPALPGPGNSPRAFGTANCHADFTDGTFLEAITVVDRAEDVPKSAVVVPLQVPERAAPHLAELIDRVLSRLRHQLDRFEGMHVLVFETPQIYAESRRLNDIGIAHSGVTSATRRTPGLVPEPIQVVEIDDHRRPTPEGRLALASPVPAGTTVHPNGAQSLAEVILCVPDQDITATVDRYADLLAVSPSHTPHGVELGLDRSRLLIATAAQVTGLLPGVVPLALPAFVAATVTVEDLGRTIAYLSAGGSTMRSSARAEVFIPAQGGLGTAIVFRQR